MAATYRLEALQVILNSLPHLYGTAMVLLDNEMNIIASALWALSMSNPHRAASLSSGGGRSSSSAASGSSTDIDNEGGGDDDDKGDEQDTDDEAKAYQSRDFSIRSVPDEYALTAAEHARGCTLGSAIRLQRVPVTGHEFATFCRCPRSGFAMSPQHLLVWLPPPNSPATPPSSTAAAPALVASGRRRRIRRLY